MIITTIITVFILFIKICDCKTYENYTLYRAIPVNPEQVSFLLRYFAFISSCNLLLATKHYVNNWQRTGNVEEKKTSQEGFILKSRQIKTMSYQWELAVQLLERLPDLYDAQIWKDPGQVLRSVDFTISPNDKKAFLKEANQSQLYLTTISMDVQKLFNQQTVKTYIRRQMTSYDWQNFYRVDDIYNWLRDLASTNAAIMDLFSIGKTVQNRDILAVKISHAPKSVVDRRSTVMVEGGIHAREWISTAFVTYLVYKVLHAMTDTDLDFQHIATSYNWVFVPLLNPDGYEYTHTQDRLWRKNRNNYGVDINRNFDIAFGTVGVSRKQSSEIYCGEKAFSEKESQAMYTLLEKFKDNLKYYLAFHSYGQYMIIPYAHLRYHVENYNQVKSLGLQVASHIHRRYGTEYIVGTAYDTVGYATSGVSGCWVKKKYGVPYVMTFELRDNGKEGFGLSPKKILPTCVETVDGLVTLLNPSKKYVLTFELRDDGKEGFALSPKQIIPTCEETVDGLIALLDPATADTDHKDHVDELKTNAGNESCLIKNIVMIIHFIVFITLCIEYSVVFLFLHYSTLHVVL